MSRRTSATRGPRRGRRPGPFLAERISEHVDRLTFVVIQDERPAHEEERLGTFVARRGIRDERTQEFERATAIAGDEMTLGGAPASAAKVVAVVGRSEPLGQREELRPGGGGAASSGIRRRVLQRRGGGRVGPVGRERQMSRPLLLVLDDGAETTMDPMTMCP